MPRFACFAAVLLTASCAGAAWAQDVAVAPLAAPDAFSTPGRETGLPKDLWRGASLSTVKLVLPLLATKTLSPAASALARRVLAAGAPGPKGAGDDPALIAARAAGLIGQGDPKAAAAILHRAPGLDRSPELARAAAEGALLAGDDARACAVSDGLSSGRDDIYWLRLRAYCQAVGGQADQAKLTFDLAQGEAKDAVFGRLMTAKIAGAGDPGAASLRNGLDYALSRNLGLDLAAAKAAPAVAAAMAPGDPAEPVFDTSAVPGDLMASFETAQKPGGDLVNLVIQIQAGDPKSRARGETVLLLALGLGTASDPEARDLMALLHVPEGKAPVARNILLDQAADTTLMGEAAILALWTCAEAGPTGIALGDRARIVRALHAVGLEADARNFALEGLVAPK